MRLTGKICTRTTGEAETRECVGLRLVSLKGASMGRKLAAGGGSVLLLCASVVFAADEPPPLLPPAVEGPASDAPGDLPPVVEAAPAAAATTPRPAAPESRPVLVVPGVTTPGNSRTRPRPVPPLVDSSVVPPAAPALVGPNNTPAQPSPRVRSTIPQPAPTARSSRSLSLETVPAEDLPEATIGPRPSTSTTPGRSPTRTQGLTEQPRTPQPRQGLLSRFLPAPVTGPRSAVEPRSRSAVTVEPRSDPAADAALKRRIERQIGDSIGPRVQFYEVRVVDRDVTIRARAARFWQRRSVRHALEGLPGLSGYRARVEMVD